MNVNPDTGVRYGVISSNSINQELLSDICMGGVDEHWMQHVDEITKQVRRSVEDGDITEDDYDDELELMLEKAGDAWSDDEPVYTFTKDGVNGRTTWLGGALLLWVFESPHIGQFKLCSPCVPNACDLNSPIEDGYDGYTVPESWLADK